MLWPPVREPCSSCPTYNNLLLEHRAAGPLHTPGRAGAEGVRKQPADHACEIMAPKRGFLKRGAGLAACKLHTLKLLTAHAKPPGACAVNMAIMAALQATSAGGNRPAEIFRTATTRKGSRLVGSRTRRFGG